MNINIVIGWATRGLVMLLALINTRLLINSVGGEGLAAYSIIVSLSPWLSLLNLGFPIAIQNAISISRGRDGSYFSMRDHAFGTMIVQTLLLFPVTLVIAYLTHKFLLVNYPFVSMGAVVGTHIFIYVTGICQLLIQVMYAEHEAFWPNIYPAFVPIWTTTTLAITQYYNIGQFNLIILIITASNLLMPIHAANRLNILSKARFNFQTILEQLASAKHQMFFATMAAATLSIDYAVMSRILSHWEIIEYNLASRLFLMLTVVHSVVLATNWTPIADLMHAGKKADARHRLEQVLKQGLLIAGGAGLLIVVAIDPLAQLLTGDSVKVIPIELCAAFWVYILLRVWTDTFAMAVQGYGMVSEINKFIPLQALISVTTQYFLGMQLGAMGIVLGLILSFMLTAAWIIPRKFYLITGG